MSSLSLIFDAYTDGSFNGKQASWAFVVIQDNKPLITRKGVLDGDINSMWQIGGEIMAAQNLILWAKELDYRINLYYDYLGVEYWATKKWKAKNPHTKAYQEFMQENAKYVNRYVKVKAHSNDFFNNFVDELAKHKA